MGYLPDCLQSLAFLAISWVASSLVGADRLEVQGQQQAPRGWEVGLLGMCIGEERRLTIPPSLGYGKRGVPKGKIVPKLPVPPNSILIYDVKLVGINGINVPTEDTTALGTRIPYDYKDCKKIGGLQDQTRAFECGPEIDGRRL